MSGRSFAPEHRAAGFARRLARGAHWLAIALIGAVALTCASQPASAVPSFARQTGQPCAACHTAFPELTPFGRRFKLSGYTLQGGDPKIPPIAAMLMPSFTNTEAPLDPGSQPPGTKTNNNLVTQQATALYAGGIYGNLGGFIQVSGNPVSGQVWLDASDVRYADSFKLFGKDAFWGIDVNNTPTVQDAWNTTPAFGFPEIATIFSAFSPPLTHVESGWGQQVAGAGAYVFWNDMLYAELTAYSGISKTGLEALGEEPGPTPDLLNGVAPYWRLAMEPHWGDHYLMIGTFGMYGQVIPAETFGFGFDDYTDVGFDSQYQYDGDKFSVTAKLTDIMEFQRLNSSFAQGNSSNLNDRLNSFKANASFVWDHTYSLSAGYFSVAGTSDAGLYSANSLTNSPDGDGLIFDVAYLPFSHGSPSPYSTYNARIGVQYTQYLKLYGGTTNFDGSGIGGTHNASGNNTLFLYAWLAF
ncbi:MAG: cytochrome C [Bradyrhizobium sp.]|nr:MAG: cytochrome C [Bradyrhizobium sp.]